MRRAGYTLADGFGLSIPSLYALYEGTVGHHLESLGFILFLMTVGCVSGSLDGLPGADARSTDGSVRPTDRRVLDAGPTNRDSAMDTSPANECETGAQRCDANADCTDTADGFSCTCRPGYVGDGQSCADLDECAVANGGCDQTCTNGVGSFACSCDDGFVIDADGVACDDIDECAVANGGCDQTCTNDVGSFACSCDDGFVLNADGTTCDEIASPERCDDLLDNDLDGKIDCEDPECLEQSCYIPDCGGGFCSMTPKCVGDGREVPRCVWTGFNCEECPDGFRVQSFVPSGGCIDGDWFVCNAPDGTIGRFDGRGLEHPGDWSNEVPGCVICNAHGGVRWELWY